MENNQEIYQKLYDQMMDLRAKVKEANERVHKLESQKENMSEEAYFTQLMQILEERDAINAEFAKITQKMEDL